MFKKPISQDISVAEMRRLRFEGLTNKQIAERLEIAPSTVYRYLGKKSLDVAWAEAQNKSNPVRVDKVVDAKPVVAKTPEAAAQPIPEPVAGKEKPVLSVIREVKILDLQGQLCTYHVDQRTGDIELGSDTESSIVKGLLSRDMLDTFISELQEIKKLLEVA